MITYIIFIFMGFYLLIKGADFLVDGASNVAKKFHIPTIIIGLTIVAIGTSMPELMVSSTAAIKGYSDMSIGNIIGSNIANLFFILGVCSIIKPLKFQKNTELIENLITIFATLILLFFGNNSKSNIISRCDGIILLTCACGFIMYNIYMAKRNANSIVEIQGTNGDDINLLKAIVYIIIGIIALKIGGDVVVKYVSKVAYLLGISEKIISITIVAFATSLPELLTSVNATIKGETDMAIGNIIGSQIFNIFLIIGTSAVLYPIKYSLHYNFDISILLIGTILFAIFPFIGKKHYMTRFNGIIFVLIYTLYLINCIIQVF
ncbi:MAG TPA: sodium:proton exchanger [Clostridiales bacterium]|nr:sodium:proton exchanger [Clostridiales bacterium]